MPDARPGTKFCAALAARPLRDIYNGRMNGTTNNPVTADVRLAALRDWIAPWFGCIELLPASADASFRRYFRIHSGGDSFIVMDAPPEREHCRPFIDIAGRLAQSGIHVPRILATDLEQGFLLLSDLGETAYLEVLEEVNADDLYADALAALIRMQALTETVGLPVYDDGRLMQELQLFPDWYLERHLGITLTPAETETLAAVFGTLVARARAQSQVFVHRDYMPRNLMLSVPNPGVLDFQDAAIGPISYDVISLFKDAFISWPEDRVDAWIAEYWQQARRWGLPVPGDLHEFRTDLDWMGLQRHLKVLGIFARIWHRDGKPHYVRDAPRFVRYVMPVADRYAGLKPLAELFRRHILPTLEEA